MSEEKKGIQHTKELLDLVFSLGGVVKQGLDDGKLDANDLGLLMLVLPKLQPAFDGIGEIPAEFKDLDEAEGKELLAHVSAGAAGVFTDEELKAKIDAGLKAGMAIYDFIKVL